MIFLSFQILPSHIAKNLILNIVINIKKIPNESDKGVVVLLSDPETDQYIQEVSHPMTSPLRHHMIIIEILHGHVIT